MVGKRITADRKELNFPRDTQFDKIVNVLAKIHQSRGGKAGHVSESSKTSLGSATLPFMALAAAVTGEASIISDFGFPILPKKFLLVVETQTSPSPKTPWWRPMQGPQPGGRIMAPA